MRRRLSLFAGLGLAILVAACGETDSAKGAENIDAPLVEIAVIAPEAAAGAVRVSGVVGYKNETALSFTSAGSIADLWVDAGDVVRRGQRLASLRRTGQGANYDEAALARANAERDLERTQQLYERGFVSEARLDDARLAVERARDSSVLTAPADGIVLRRLAERSQTVGAGAPVLAFGETRSGFVVRAPVASGAAARMRVGDTANVRLGDLGEATRQGRVTRIAAQSDAATGAFEVEIALNGVDGLRSGMVAEAEVASAPSQSVAAALLAPTLSLMDARADQGVVFVVDENNLARRRAVRIAGLTQAGVLIAEGLAPGERVVASGAAYVRDGEPVRIADAAR